MFVVHDGLVIRSNSRLYVWSLLQIMDKKWIYRYYQHTIRYYLF